MPLARELAEAARERQESKIKLADAFARAARKDSEGESGGSASGGPQPSVEPRIEHNGRRKIDLSREFNDAAANPGDGGLTGGLRARLVAGARKMTEPGIAGPAAAPHPQAPS